MIVPFQQLSAKGTKFKWQKHDQLYEDLKLDILNAPALHPFDTNLEIRVYNDASSVQAGGILACYNPET